MRRTTVWMMLLIAAVAALIYTLVMLFQTSNVGYAPSLIGIAVSIFCFENALRIGRRLS